MPSNKNMNINYTNRDFDTIKQDLVNYAQKYYPNIIKDFSEGSFGSLLLDTVAYLGDSMSFYLDYSVNEGFLHSALELKNVMRQARQLGYKHRPLASSFGTVEIKVLIPSNDSDNTPNTDYLPIIKKGSTFTSQGGSEFTLVRDIDFNNSSTAVAEKNSNGKILYYIVTNVGLVISGINKIETHEVGDFVRFNKVFLDDENVIELLSVVDSAGHEYYEVEHLSQDVIYRVISNTDPSTLTDAPSILKPMAVPRRFTLERDRENQPYLQFGTVSNNEILNKDFVDPNEVVLDLHGRDYVTDKHFDPSNLFSNDKFGVSPSNTTLTIEYRSAAADNVNAPAGSLTGIGSLDVGFKNELSLTQGLIDTVISSVAVNNPSPILGDVDAVSIEEARILATDSFATQNRAVTKSDYMSIVYRMPPELGSIKRINVFQDNDSFKRNINMYVLSEDSNGNLTQTPGIIKSNLKTWLNSYKMINDTIDILDAYVVTIGVNFVIIPQPHVSKFDALTAALDKLQEEMISPKYNIGEPFYITDVYKYLKEVDEVLDVVDVVVTNLTTSNHSNVYYDVEENTSADGRIILAKERVCFEIRYADDIKGAVI